MSTTYYRVTNTTVKPPRYDKNGKDLRTTVEKVGHAVTFKKNKDEPVTLIQGKHVIISNIEEGLMNMARGGLVSIQKIDDIATALKEHTLERQKQREATNQALKEEQKPKRVAKAVQMGEDKHGADVKEQSEYSGAVNPDGNPNFVAVATKKKRGRRKKEQTAEA